jgi:hypothetical protein
MQALGSDEGGRMLFLGLGSGLGTALVDDGRVVPLELAHLPFRDQTFEDICGQRGRNALGDEAWRAAVLEAAETLRAAVAAEYVVLGGGNVRLMKDLPPRVRRGHNDRAFEGGFRLWADGQPLAPAWRALQAHAANWAPAPAPHLPAPGPSHPPAPARTGSHLSHLFENDPDRAQAFTLRLDDLVVDYSKNHWRLTMRLLVELARATGGMICVTGVRRQGHQH